MRGVLHVACPRCGRPVRVTIASHAVIRCPACAYSGAPSADAATHLEKADAILRAGDVRDRQLSSAQQGAIRRALVWQRLQAVLLAGGALPFVGWLVLALAVSVSDEASAGVGVVFGVTPVSLYLLVGFASYRASVASRARLFEVCAANPPDVPGAPAECHLCGGPVVPRAADPIVRCPYCGCDNVVHPLALQAARTRRDRDVMTLEADVASRSRAVATVGVAASALTIGSVFVTPVVSFFASLVAIVVLVFTFVWVVELDPLPHRYVLAPTPSGMCVARYRVEDGKATIEITGAKGKPQRTAAPAGAQPFGPSGLIGKRLRHSSNGAAGVVRKVTANPILGVNQVIVSGDQKFPVPGTCLAP